MGENVVEILHIYGGRAIFILFYVNLDTEYESWEIDIGVARPIFTHKNIKEYV